MGLHALFVRNFFKSKGGYEYHQKMAVCNSDENKELMDGKDNAQHSENDDELSKLGIRKSSRKRTILYTNKLNFAHFSNKKKKKKYENGEDENNDDSDAADDDDDDNDDIRDNNSQDQDISISSSDVQYDGVRRKRTATKIKHGKLKSKSKKVKNKDLSNTTITTKPIKS